MDINKLKEAIKNETYDDYMESNEYSEEWEIIEDLIKALEEQEKILEDKASIAFTHGMLDSEVHQKDLKEQERKYKQDIESLRIELHALYRNSLNDVLNKQNGQEKHLRLSEEGLGEKIYELCGGLELSTQRKVAWWELSPNWRDFYNRIAKAIEQYVKKGIDSVTLNHIKDLKEIKKDYISKERHEQYVIKARIRQLEYVKQQEAYGGYCIDEDIAQLKKGLNEK